VLLFCTWNNKQIFYSLIISISITLTLLGSTCIPIISQISGY
jgi:hypothetical protein